MLKKRLKVSIFQRLMCFKIFTAQRFFADLSYRRRYNARRVTRKTDRFISVFKILSHANAYTPILLGILPNDDQG